MNRTRIKEPVVTPSTVMFKSNEAVLPPEKQVIYSRWQDWGIDFTMFPGRFESTSGHPLMFKIGDQVFTKWSEEFQELYDKTIFWARLKV